MRAIEHPMNTFADLDFVIPAGVQNASAINKGFIYADNYGSGVSIIDRLTEQLPENMRGLGLIRPYNAAFSKAYRREVMRLFKLGTIRVLVCTDAAGMVSKIVSEFITTYSPGNSRAVIYLTSTLLCSGSCRDLSPSLCRELDGPRAPSGLLGLL
jgi:hypothetical protein